MILRLRTKLMLVFIAGMLAPMLVTVWIGAALLDRSLKLSSTHELDTLSASLQQTGRGLYQSVRRQLTEQARRGATPEALYSAIARNAWPPGVRDFWNSGEPELFTLAGKEGDRLQYLLRREGAVWEYSAPLEGVRLKQLANQYVAARSTIEGGKARDIRRGYLFTLVSLAAMVWLAALAALLYWAQRISSPIQALTQGLAEVAEGRLEHRVAVYGSDEIGSAAMAFNHMAEQLRQSRDRLVYTTRLESWQALARKMAHEIKNSLTPIRLTMEEIAARGASSDPLFLEQAAQIVIEEVSGLERRVRTFTELGSEPPINPKPIDMNQMLEDRISLLRAAHPEVTYSTRLAAALPAVLADEDLVRGVLTNLLENAAQAGTAVLGVTAVEKGRVKIEVHDSGPGLSQLARGALFEPTISFKRGGMGLGLSIAKRSAVLCGGEIELVEGELGGAGFRVLLPAV